MDCTEQIGRADKRGTGGRRGWTVCIMAVMVAALVYIWLGDAGADKTQYPLHNLIIALMAALAFAAALLVIRFDGHTGNRFGFALLYAGVEILALLFIVRSRTIISHIEIHTLLSCGMLAIGTLIFCVLFCGIIQKRWEIWKLGFCLILILGLGYSAVFRPFSIPDEETHYWASYALANQMLNKAQQDTDDSIAVRTEDSLFVLSSLAADSLSDSHSVVIAASDYAKMLKQFRLFAESDETETVSMWKPTSVPLAYWFSALGIVIGRIFNLSGMITFYWGRLLNLLVYAIGVTAAVKMIPYGKKAILGMAILPMSLHLAASYSYDGIVLVEALLFAALTVRISNQHTVMRTGQRWALCLSGALLAPSKVVYVPLLLIVLLIPETNYKNQKDRRRFVCLFFLCAFVALAITQTGNIVKKADLGQLKWTDQPPHTIQYVITHISEMISTLFYDLYIHADFYWASSISQYLGWHQISSSNMMLALCSVCLLLCCVRTADETIPVLNARQKAGVAIIALMIVLLVQVSMLMSWTPIGYGSIAGVQGRYFLPAFPLLLLLVRSNHLSISREAGDGALFVLAVGSFAVILDLLLKLTI